MNKETQFRKFFKLASLLTDHYPKSGAHFLNEFLHILVGNKILLSLLAARSKHSLKRAKGLYKFLVIGDLNIGDAVISISAISALKEIFPNSELDLVVKKSTGNLFIGNLDISNLYPIYEGAPYPNERDLIELKKIVINNNYDLIINFSPMISSKVFGDRNVVNYTMMAPQLVRGEHFTNSVNHITYQSYNFIGRIFSNYLPPSFDRNFKGSKIYLPDEAIETAKAFLSKYNITDKSQIIMFNPDASAKFTRIPFDIQLSLLNKFIDLNLTVLLGSGHVEKLIESKLINSLPVEKREKIIVVPASMSLDSYSALIDFSDIYISGDTGPLHLSAARKYSRSTGKSLRNKTAVFSVFGATPPRIYGYDSTKEGFFAANQDAPSKIFIAPSPCRNITCIDKLGKACSDVRCFQSLDANKIVSEAIIYLKSIRKNKVEKIETMRQRKIVA